MGTIAYDRKVIITIIIIITIITIIILIVINPGLRHLGVLLLPYVKKILIQIIRKECLKSFVSQPIIKIVIVIIESSSVMQIMIVTITPGGGGT